jgi:hypothetical protein
VADEQLTCRSLGAAGDVLCSCWDGRCTVAAQYGCTLPTQKSHPKGVVACTFCFLAYAMHARAMSMAVRCHSPLEQFAVHACQHTLGFMLRCSCLFVSRPGLQFMRHQMHARWARGGACCMHVRESTTASMCHVCLSYVSAASSLTMAADSILCMLANSAAGHQCHVW